MYIIPNRNLRDRYPPTINNRYEIRIPKVDYPGVFNIVKINGKETKYKLEHNIKKFKVPDKIYGNLNFYIDYYWKAFVRHQFQCGLLLTGTKGAGKALAVDTPIRIKDGWKPIGEIKVGDKVIGNDGLETKVTGVYPQGVKQLYRVTFSDGRYVDTCIEHLWSVNYPVYKNHKRIFIKKIMNTGEMIEYLKQRKKRKIFSSEIYIDMVIPERNEDKDLYIEPYVLGVLIGDGHIKTLRITNIYDHVLNRVKDLLPDEYTADRYPSDLITFAIKYKDKKESLKTNNLIKIYLEKIGLLNTRSWEKFIPEEYMNGSTIQRISLLQGLLDTDGDVSKNGSISYTTTSKRLAEDVQLLVRSLGGMCKIHQRVTHYTYLNVKKPGRVSYRLNIRFKNPKTFTTLPKHNERLKFNNQYSLSFGLRIKSIEKVNKQEAVCISVDNKDKLFVAKDYIVTHNTELGKVLANKCIEFGLKVVMISNVRYTPELIQFLESLDEVVFFFDEFSKIFNYNVQDKMLTLLSNTNDRRRIVIITENALNSINEHIRNRPGRLRYSKHFRKVDITVVDEFCKDYNIDKNFYKKLLKLHAKSLDFTFDHLHALVTEHLDSPELDFDEILDILNMDSFIGVKNIILKDIRIHDDASEKYKECEVDISKSRIVSSVTLDMLERGFVINVELYCKDKNNPDEESKLMNVLSVSARDIEVLLDEEIVFKLKDLTITCILAEDGARDGGGGNMSYGGMPRGNFGL